MTFGFSLVEEFTLCGVVTAHDDMVAPAGKVPDDFEVRRAWGDAF